MRSSESHQTLGANIGIECRDGSAMASVEIAAVAQPPRFVGTSESRVRGMRAAAGEFAPDHRPDRVPCGERTDGLWASGPFTSRARRWRPRLRGQRFGERCHSFLDEGRGRQTAFQLGRPSSKSDPARATHLCPCALLSKRKVSQGKASVRQSLTAG